VLREAPFDALGAGDPRGMAALRNELMGYLARARGAAPEPEHTIICTGFTQAFAMLCRALHARGVERIALEDPGYAQHRLIAERAGLQVEAVPVDGEGLNVRVLDDSDCEVVVLTPAHQFPTGVVLSPERRAGLLEWAEERDALIVEDDYDSELRYDRVAVGALQGLAPERVCHIGSLSKRLAPGLRIGWILSPSWMTGEVTYEKGIGDGGCPVVEQLAAAEFIARGELDRHLRRMRLQYRARRAALLAALTSGEVIGVAAGLYVLVRVPEQTSEAAVVAAAAERDVAIDALSWHRLTDHGAPGIVIGFGNLPEAALARAGAILEDIITHIA
jgi:GntR family transcriptional regulator/MocR family aminotransferase